MLEDRLIYLFSCSMLKRGQCHFKKEIVQLIRVPMSSRTGIYYMPNRAAVLNIVFFIRMRIFFFGGGEGWFTSKASFNILPIGLVYGQWMIWMTRFTPLHERRPKSKTCLVRTKCAIFFYKAWFTATWWKIDNQIVIDRYIFLPCCSS